MIIKNKRVLLTGAGGSIGLHIMSYILNSTDWDIVCLDSFHHKGYRDRIQLLKYKWSKRIFELQTDLVCPISDELTKAIGKVDYILHLAALSDVFLSVENPEYVIKNNVNSTITMLEYARKVKPEQFIYFSTDEVYGPVKRGGKHKEWETHRPSNAYAASKAASEDICYAYWRSYGVPVIITNTMNNFGETQSASKFPVLIQKAVEEDREVIIHGNKKEIGTRYYIHSWNVADALMFIIKKGARLHKLGELDEPHRYNIVGDECMSNLQLAQAVAKLMGKELRYKMVDFHKDNPAHDIHYGIDGKKMKNLGWKSPNSFEDSMKNTIEWQQKNKEWI